MLSSTVFKEEEQDVDNVHTAEKAVLAEKFSASSSPTLLNVCHMCVCVSINNDVVAASSSTHKI